MQNLFQEDYGNFRMRLQVSGARRVLDGVDALRSEKTADELKDYFKTALNPFDAVVVLEVGSFSTRRAAFDLAEL